MVSPSPTLLRLSIGRQGAPKQRVLHCAPDATLLYWGDKSSYKSVFLDEVRAIRLGLDIDPASSSSGAGGAGGGAGAVKGKGGGGGGGVLYGTETLRRNCKRDELVLCFSLILPTR